MTREEVIAFYASMSSTSYAKRVVSFRADFTDDENRRAGNSCLCGYCGVARRCACGKMRTDGMACWNCRRPDWCET